MRLVGIIAVLAVLGTSFSATAADEEKSVLDQEDYDESVPPYEQAKAHWAFGLEAAVRKFPTGGAFGNIIHGYSEYLVTLGPLGIFGIGLHAGLYPLDVLDELPVDYTNLGVGGHLRYQLKFMDNQWIVPTAALRYTYIRLAGIEGGAETITANNAGLSYGLLIALNPFDRQTARLSYADWGLKRSYVSVEMMTYDFETDDLVTSGPAWFLGFRFEI